MTTIDWTTTSNQMLVALGYAIPNSTYAPFQQVGPTPPIASGDIRTIGTTLEEALLSAGAAYDAVTSEFLGDVYVAGESAWLELDRICRYVYVNPQTYMGSVLAVGNAAASFGLSSTPKWGASVVYGTGAGVQPTPSNGFTYVTSIPGTSGSFQPTFPTTLGATVVDGSDIVWQCVSQVLPSLPLPFDPTLQAATALNARFSVAVNLANGNEGVVALISEDWFAWQTALANIPAPSSDAVSATAALQTALANCNAWLASASFT